LVLASTRKIWCFIQIRDRKSVSVVDVGSPRPVALPGSRYMVAVLSVPPFCCIKTSLFSPKEIVFKFDSCYIRPKLKQGKKPSRYSQTS
jgi:hypothetical protein